MGRKRYEQAAIGQTPTRPAGAVTADVVIPGLRAVVSGGLICAVWILGVQLWRGWWLSWPAGAFIWAVASLVIWGLSTWRGLLHGLLERATRRDLDGDGYIGGDPDRLILVRTKQDAAQAAQVQRRAQFDTFVRACEANGDTSSRRWEKTLGRTTYNRWRSVLIEAGYAKWRSPGAPGQGWELTVTADTILDALD